MDIICITNRFTYHQLRTKKKLILRVKVHTQVEDVRRETARSSWFPANFRSRIPVSVPAFASGLVPANSWSLYWFPETIAVLGTVTDDGSGDLFWRKDTNHIPPFFLRSHMGCQISNWYSFWNLLCQNFQIFLIFKFYKFWKFAQIYV
jgi:hypothetical protein